MTYILYVTYILYSSPIYFSILRKDSNQLSEPFVDINSVMNFRMNETTMFCEDSICEMNFNSKCFQMEISTTTPELSSTTESTVIFSSTGSTSTSETSTAILSTLTTWTSMNTIDQSSDGLLSEEIALIILSIISFLMLLIIMLLLYHLKSLKKKLHSKRIESRNYWIWNIQQPKFHWK